MMVSILFSILLLLVISYYVFWRKRWMSVLERNGIKGPKPHFIYGNLKVLEKEDNIRCVDRWLKEYGSIFGYYDGGRPMVVITDPELLMKVFIKDFKLFKDRYAPKELSSQTNTELVSSSLIRREGKEWKELRSLLSPAFSATRQKEFIPDMNDAIDSLIENIEKERLSGKADIDIFPLFEQLTIDIIGRTSFGFQANVQQNPNDPFLRALHKISNGMSGPIFRKPLTLFPEFTGVIYKIRLLLVKLRSIFYENPARYLVDLSSHVIAERRKTKNNSRKDLLQAMIDGKIGKNVTNEVDYNSLSNKFEFEKIENKEKESDGRSLSDVEIISNSIIFFEAGFETTSATLAFVMHFLVNNTELQEKVRKEVIEVVKKTGMLDYDSINELSFMEAVIYETLRIYPPLHSFVTRKCDTNYKYKNITIPKGVSLVSPVYHIHHDPRFWQQPEKFDPHRFYGENKSNKKSLLWQPFGIGPRNCIGMKFAMLELKLTIAKLLLNFQFVAGPRTEIGHLSFVSVRSALKPSHVYIHFVPIKKVL